MVVRKRAGRLSFAESRIVVSLNKVYIISVFHFRVLIRILTRLLHALATEGIKWLEDYDEF